MENGSVKPYCETYDHVITIQRGRWERKQKKTLTDRRWGSIWTIAVVRTYRMTNDYEVRPENESRLVLVKKLIYEEKASICFLNSMKVVRYFFNRSFRRYLDTCSSNSESKKKAFDSVKWKPILKIFKSRCYVYMYVEG